MRIPSIVLLLSAMPGCGSGTEPAQTSAESASNQVRTYAVEIPEKQAAIHPEKTPAVKTPDAVVRKHVTPDRLAPGNPVVNSFGMKLVLIPAGEFQMGKPESDSDVRHLVKIMQPFYLGVYEVTRQQYEQVMGTHPWQGRPFVKEGGDYPAVYVTNGDAAELCRKLSEQKDVEYRLPTEAQWEYACRAGTTTVYSFRNDQSKLGQHAWYAKNTFDAGEKYAHRVGEKLPNPWGLYDMHGNVSEWCQDWYAPYGSEKVVSDPMGPGQGDFRVLRGRAFIDTGHVRSASRYANQPDYRIYVNGFRLARMDPGAA